MLCKRNNRVFLSFLFCLTPSSKTNSFQIKSKIPNYHHSLKRLSLESSETTEQSDEERIQSVGIENLRRKVNANRPFLGHVVPRNIRKDMYRQNQMKKRGGSNIPQLQQQGKKSQGKNNPSNLRIIAGAAKGRRLKSPNVYLRPMMGKVKQALFSTLNSFGLYDENVATKHLDIFAGSGSVGLESLSRGATHCTFVDFSNDCCETISENFERCKFSSTTTFDVKCCDAIQSLKNPSSAGITNGPYHVITICPPYEEVIYADILEALLKSPLVQEDSIIIIEYPKEIKSMPPVIKDNEISNKRVLIGTRNRKYGRTVVAMYIANPSGRMEVANSRPEEFLLF